MTNQEKEEIKIISIKDLHPFEEHPFKVRDDMAMDEMVESIKESGILTPITVRPREEGGYEIISGHRRVHACELAGITETSSIVRNCSRDEAIIMMVDSNLQRESILPSEKAKAYKMKLEAMNHRVGRPSKEKTENYPQLEDNLSNKGKKSVQIIAEQANTSRAQVERYIRLTELHPEIQKKVDEKEMGITPAVELSYLTPHEQELLIETMDSEGCTPSLSQAQRMRKMSNEGTLNEDTMLEMMMEQKKPEQQKVILTPAKISKFFPRNYTAEQVETVVLKLLENWHKRVLEKKQMMKQQQLSTSQPSKKKTEHSL